MLLSPVMLLFYQANGLGAKELFFFQGVFYLVSLLAEAPVGYFSNKVSRKYLLLFSFSLYFILISLWVFMRGYYVILVGEMIFAVSKISMDNAMSGYLYDYLGQKNMQNKMSVAYGHLNFFLALGTAVAALIGVVLYEHFGINLMLFAQLLLIASTIILMTTLPNIKNTIVKKETLKEDVLSFIESLRAILRRKSLKYHIFLSGLLTSCSILFALSFQPLIQNSLLPVFMFGVVMFFNHGTRSVASLLVNKVEKYLSLSGMSKWLLFLFSLSFVLILSAIKLNNKIFTVLTIFLVCLFIGLQLIFTTIHVSRLHKKVSDTCRGSIMAVNNFVSRAAAAIILLTSKIFTTKSKLDIYFIVVFLVFILICPYLTNKVSNAEE